MLSQCLFFSYRNERGSRVNVQWVIRSIYEDGYVSLCFTDEVLLMLKVFDENNPFTKYKKEVMSTSLPHQTFPPHLCIYHIWILQLLSILHVSLKPLMLILRALILCNAL